MAQLRELRAGYSVAISELREAPQQAIDAAGSEAVAVLNHNEPVAYVVSPKMMHELLDLAADKLESKRAVSRMATMGKSKRINLDDL